MENILTAQMKDVKEHIELIVINEIGKVIFNCNSYKWFFIENLFSKEDVILELERCITTMSHEKSDDKDVPTTEEIKNSIGYKEMINSGADAIVNSYGEKLSQPR
jgi:nucleoside-triphosphatase THEP1